MRYVKIILTLIQLSFVTVSYAQQIKDGETIDLNGMAVTFRIVNKSTVNVKGQTFGRYQVVGAVKNNTGKVFNVRLRSVSQSSLSEGSGKIVEFNCINAAGARLTSKSLLIGMAAHRVTVNYYTRDNNGKSYSTNMTIIAGYFLDEGQIVESSGIFIVPTGEVPQVSVRSMM